MAPALVIIGEMVILTSIVSSVVSVQLLDGKNDGDRLREPGQELGYVLLFIWTSEEK